MRQMINFLIYCIAFHFQLLRDSVDSYLLGQTIPACHVQLVWLKVGEHPKELSHMIHVIGLVPDTFIRVFRGQEKHIPNKIASRAKLGMSI